MYIKNYVKLFSLESLIGVTDQISWENPHSSLTEISSLTNVSRSSLFRVIHSEYDIFWLILLRNRTTSKIYFQQDGEPAYFSLLILQWLK